jgi:hypothetical protein
VRHPVGRDVERPDGECHPGFGDHQAYLGSSSTGSRTPTDRAWQLAGRPEHHLPPAAWKPKAHRPRVC